ncbi:hypothetical protein [Winogradskyella luteola]|uniref:Uncharacterized protein n=1 Tax=Winogradskyella luteola TaxID=2828330 RepID=A0A9X1JPW8_9FLAO|nr:hypothetical protein [Winogradskyella luteola]MBV7268358.1 hypothetical protein [Winogradskyella luteola]
MSRSINEIQDVMLNAIGDADELDTLQVLTDAEKVQLQDQLTSASKVSIWRLFVWVHAFGQWVSEKLWDVLRSDIEKRISETRPFTKQWYALTALNYQHGYDLPETGIYPIPNASAEIQAVNASKIVKKASVIPTVLNGVGSLRVKVAKDNNGLLAPFTTPELAGFQQYIELMGAAGVYVVATSGTGDDLKLHYKIYYDALILDNEGKRLDGTNDTPVQAAVKSFLASSQFDGLLDINQLTDAIQLVDGVSSPHKVLAASKYAAFTYETEDIPGAGSIADFRQPDAGYFNLDEVESTFEFVESYE